MARAELIGVNHTPCVSAPWATAVRIARTVVRERKK